MSRWLNLHNSLLLLDDVGFHRSEGAEELILLMSPDLELVERADEIFHQSIKVGASDAHAHMGRLHVLTFVLARSAASLTDLVDEVSFELLQPLRVGSCRREERVDALVRRYPSHELVNHGCNGLLAAEAVVQRLLIRGALAEQRRARYRQQNGSDQQRSTHTLRHDVSLGVENNDAGLWSVLRSWADLGCMPGYARPSIMTSDPKKVEAETPPPRGG